MFWTAFGKHSRGYKRTSQIKLFIKGFSYICCSGHVCIKLASNSIIKIANWLPVKQPFVAETLITALTYLCIGQHDVLDEGQAAGFTVLDADVVHLVPADLPVLFPWQQRAPHHLDGGGVEHLDLHTSRGGPGYCGGKR